MTKRNIKLPDYSAAFHTGDIRPLRFRTRSDSNFVHDVQFLSGYLHDARVAPKEVKLRGNRLTLTVHRDCWEIGYKKHRDSIELYTARAQLVIKPVHSIRWEMAGLLHLEKPFWVNSIYLGANHWELTGMSELIITSASAAGVRLRVGIAGDFGDIQLDDLEVPRLHNPLVDLADDG